MNKVPKQVRIMGKWINFNYLSEIPNDSHELYGEYKHNDKKILIKKDEPDEDQFRTMLHEIMHGIIARSAIKNLIDDNMEEAICELSENFADYLQWNYGAEDVKYQAKSKIK